MLGLRQPSHPEHLILPMPFLFQASSALICRSLGVHRGFCLAAAILVHQ